MTVIQYLEQLLEHRKTIMECILYLIAIISISFEMNRADSDYEYESDDNILKAIRSSNISSKGTRLVGARKGNLNKDNIGFVASISVVSNTIIHSISSESQIIYHISYLISHISYLISHFSYLISHISYLISHISYFSHQACHLKTMVSWSVVEC